MEQNRGQFCLLKSVRFLEQDGRFVPGKTVACWVVLRVITRRERPMRIVFNDLGKV
jgi:hypothetical protein